MTRDSQIARIAAVLHEACDWEHYMGHEPSERDDLLAIALYEAGLRAPDASEPEWPKPYIDQHGDWVEADVSEPRMAITRFDVGKFLLYGDEGEPAPPPETRAEWLYSGQHDDCIATIAHYHARQYRPGDWGAGEPVAGLDAEAVIRSVPGFHSGTTVHEDGSVSSGMVESDGSAMWQGEWVQKGVIVAVLADRLAVTGKGAVE